MTPREAAPSGHTGTYSPPSGKPKGRHMQTKLGSLTEAAANIAVGFAINFTANMLVLPLFGFSVTAGAAFGIGLIFTVISLVRSYVLWRWFNGLQFGNRVEFTCTAAEAPPKHVVDQITRQARAERWFP